MTTPPRMHREIRPAVPLRDLPKAEFAKAEAKWKQERAKKLNQQKAR